MDDKPEFYTLTEVVDHLKDSVPRERIAIDIGRGLLPVGAALPPVGGEDHISRELMNQVDDESDKALVRWGKRSRLVWLEPATAATLLRETRNAALRTAKYPRFVDANGDTERYLVETVTFAPPSGFVAVEPDDIIIFAFQLTSYICNVRGLDPVELHPLPKLSKGGSYIVGRKYDIGWAAEQFSEDEKAIPPRPANKVVSGSGAVQAGQRQPRIITGSGGLKAGAVAAESKPDARDIGADSEAKNAASPSFSAGDIARQFWNMQLNMHRAFYPDPPHTGCVPVARIVHVLALRQFFALIENSATAQWRPEWSLERYARAAFMLNAAISKAAKSGALKLRDISTGVPLTGWLDSSPAEFWESFDAIFRRQNLAEAPKFFLFILRRRMHFQNDVVVNLAEFQEWAAAEKLAEPEDLARLLAEVVPDDVKRLLNGEMVSTEQDHPRPAGSAGGLHASPPQQSATPEVPTTQTPQYRLRWRMDRILEAIQRLKLNPLALPHYSAKEGGGKSLVRAEFDGDPSFTRKQFDKAWEQLSAEGAICYESRAYTARR